VSLSTRAAVLTTVLLYAARASALCTLSVTCHGNGTNDAMPILQSCCGADRCTLDGQITLNGSACLLDFDGRSVSISGRVAMPSGTLEVNAASIAVANGTIDVSSAAGSGGTVTLHTRGSGTTAVAMTGAQSLIDLHGGSVLGGGSLTILADGPVSLRTGQIIADGTGSGSSGGSVDIESTAGDTTLGARITARNAADGFLGGTVTVRSAGALNVENVVDVNSGEIDMRAVGAVLIDSGATVDASDANGNDGGTIMIQGSAVTVKGVVSATAVSDATGGEVDVTGAAGTITVVSNGITVDGDDGTISLVTNTPVPDGSITVSAPLSAQGNSSLDTGIGGGTVSLDAQGTVTVNGRITVNGSGGGTGEVDLSALRDVAVNGQIVGNDPGGGATVSILSGTDTTVANAVQLRGTSGDFSGGGDFTAVAGGSVIVNGGVILDLTGVTGPGGSIELAAEHDVQVGPHAGLVTDAADPTQGTGGLVTLLAGTRCPPGGCNAPSDAHHDVSGNLTVGGNIAPATSGASGPGRVDLEACQVTVSSTAVINGNGSDIAIVARGPVTVASGATLQTSGTGTSTLDQLQGAAFTHLGTVSPPLVPTPHPACTAASPNAPGCLDPCPTCGDGQVQFPEQCDPGTISRCDAHHCDPRCRTETCAASDGTTCTVAGCDPVGGCWSTSLLSDECDDHNPCTADCFDPSLGQCTHAVRVGGDCGDGNPCNGAETCDANAICQPGTPVVCATGTVCDRTDGTCKQKVCASAGDCNDGNPCTKDTCDGTTHLCSSTPSAQLSCADTNPCNGTETCLANGACKPGTPLDCDDGNPCTADSCNPGTGCVHTPIPLCCQSPSDCGGTTACPFVCDNNVCAAEDPECCATNADCDDGNDCTADSCNLNHQPHPQCIHAPVAKNTPCGEVCDPGTCDANGTCVLGPPTTCPDDGDPCTLDVCRPFIGCEHEPCQGRATCDVCRDDGTGAQCSCHSCATDLDCGPQGRCSGDACVGGVCTKVATCEDFNPHTGDTCTLDAQLQPHCAHPCLDDDACDDHNACNGHETCDAATGTCHPGTALACDDGDPCNGVETCDPATGCRGGTPLTGLPGVLCKLDAFDAAVAGASVKDLAKPLRAKLVKNSKLVRNKIAAATKAKAKKKPKLLHAASKTVHSMVQAITAAGKKRRHPQISSALEAKLLAILDAPAIGAGLGG
jgi:hypothetical protein